ncbi:MAG TPA: NAD(P)-binding domain-containing protein [Acidimicrobiales bacterium]
MSSAAYIGGQVNIAILGTGKVSVALGSRLSDAGNKVTIGSRTPEEHPGAVTYAEAVQASELVITAIPGRVLLETLDAIGEDVLGDRIVLDMSVPFAEDMSLAYPNDSVGRLAQAKFPRARVVKSLNTMNVSMMIDPLATLPAATIFVSGDAAEAKAGVVAVLHDLGWTDDCIIDLGGIETAIGTEHFPPLFRVLVQALGTPRFCITVSR